MCLRLAQASGNHYSGKRGVSYRKGKEDRIFYTGREKTWSLALIFL